MWFAVRHSAKTRRAASTDGAPVDVGLEAWELYREAAQFAGRLAMAALEMSQVAL